MMRILQSFYNFEVGGSQVLAVDLMNEMCLKHEVYLVVINKEWSDELIRRINKKVKVFYVRRQRGSFNPFPVLRFNWLLWKLKPDVIHCHDPSTAGLVMLKNIRLLQTIHDVGMQDKYYDLYDVSIAISDTVFNEVTRSPKATSVKTIYNGADFNAFFCRSEYLLNDRPLKFVQVSRLVHHKKGQDILLYALHQLIFKYKLKNITLDLIGVGESQVYLEELIDKLELTQYVNLIGERNREWLYQNLFNYHLLVQPSRYEGFGLTIIEGFAAGLPVLTSDIDGPAEIVSNLKGGFVFKNGDSNSCAKMLAHIYDLYQKNEIAVLMKGTYDKVINKYSIQQCVENYLQEYHGSRTILDQKFYQA